MISKGKSYHAKKPKEQRPQHDNYSTPKSLVWEFLKAYPEDLTRYPMWDPARGSGQIVRALEESGVKEVMATDITLGINFLDLPKKIELLHNCCIFTNPPFYLWDQFVAQGKKLTYKKLILLGRLNYFASVGRYRSHLWDDLESVWTFDRQVDFRTPDREDGHFHVGGLVTGWFVWSFGPKKDPTIHILDVQKYATLGQFHPDRAEDPAL